MYMFTVTFRYFVCKLMSMYTYVLYVYCWSSALDEFSSP